MGTSQHAGPDSAPDTIDDGLPPPGSSLRAAPPEPTPPAPGDPAAHTDEQIRYIERFALSLAAVGLPRMAARVFVALLVSPDGQRTAAELAATLGISPAAVSQATRYLVTTGLIGREREPGRRRDHYRVFDDVWIDMYAHRDRAVTRLAVELDAGVPLFGEHTPAGRRLVDSRRFFEFAQGELPHMVARWRAYNARVEDAAVTPEA